MYSLTLWFPGFVLIGTVFDAGVWYFVKNVRIFDDEDVKAVVSPVPSEEQMINTKILHLDNNDKQHLEMSELTENGHQNVEKQNNIQNHINQTNERSQQTLDETSNKH